MTTPISVPSGMIAAHREIVRLMQANDWATALGQIDRALVAQPQVAVLHINRGQCLLALGHRKEACDAVAAGQSRAPGDAGLADAAGSVFSFAGDQTQALRAYDRAVTLAPTNAQFLFNRATVRRFLGQLDAAEKDYDRVIALRPADFEAYKNRADLRTQTPERNHLLELERVAAGKFADWRGEVQIGFALAKEYEDVARYDESFRHLQRAAAKRRKHMSYDVAGDVATAQWIIEAFPQPPEPGDGGAGAASATANESAVASEESPIFIVGLPRSGTTLVDRILGSHSAVESAGELNDFALALVDAVRRSSGATRLTRQELVAQSARIDFSALGRDYLQRAHRLVPPGRFTDKMPLNYLYCGLILRALPRARIVHLTRHPLAVCYAMYKTLFKDGYPFSYDLGDLARYYVAYRRLMDHWQATLPGRIHELSYEALVSDQTAQTRRLLEFCGLEWEDACLDFHRNAAATTTASASQIRKPLYDSSVAQWRHYAAQLAPLRSELDAAGIPL